MRKYTFFSIVVILSLLLGGCAKATPEVIKETVEVKQTQIVVEKQVVKETQVVKEEVKGDPAGQCCGHCDLPSYAHPATYANLR